MTAGQLSQPYKVLGSVHADTVGLVNVGSVVSDALFRGRLAANIQATPKASPPRINEMLQARAIKQFGFGEVDAIINVTYRTDPNGDVYADGIAVQFPWQAPSSMPAPVAQTPGERLQTLKNLLDKGLITHDQYEKKRADILKEL